MHGALGGFIRATRERAGLKQQELAELVFHHVAWIRRVERGGVATVTPIDAERLCEVLHLPPWETSYLYVMLGYPPPHDPADDASMREYVDALDPHAAAWVSTTGPNHVNAPFRRLFPAVESAPYVGAWLFSDAAREVIENWGQIADWWISDARFRMAFDDQDSFFGDVINHLSATLPAFKEKWEASPIPGNPAPPVWRVRTADGIVNVSMRVWWQVPRRGLLLQGVVDPSLIQR